MKKLIKNQLTRKGELMLSVDGISMLPTIKKGDTVRIVAADEYVQGEIIVFEYNGRLVVHRILKIKDSIFFL